jgi:hypothetical protein
MIRRDLRPESLAYVLVALRIGLLNVDDFLPGMEAVSLDNIGETLAAVLERALSPLPDEMNEIDQQKGQTALNMLLSMGRVMIQQQREQHRQLMAKQRQLAAKKERDDP